MVIRTMAPYLTVLFHSLTASLQSRLSRRIAFLIFCSVIAAEAVFLIPLIAEREQKLVSGLKGVSAGKLSTFWEANLDTSKEESLQRLKEFAQRYPLILGGAVYDRQQGLLGTFGSMSELSRSHPERSGQTSLFLGQHRPVCTEVALSEAQNGYTALICHDVSSIRLELVQHSLRMLGLSLLIAILITIIVLIALDKILVRPIFKLQEDLQKAGQALRTDQSPEFHPLATGDHDELGEACTAFRQTFSQVEQTIEQRKQIEAELEERLQAIKADSKALCLELKTAQEIQKDFLPKNNEIEHLSIQSGWEITSFYKPARQVAGDFYDTFKIDDAAVGLVIGDTCDKGVGAALFMGIFRSLIRLFSRQGGLKEFSCMVNGIPILIENGLTVNSVHLNALKAIKLTNDYIAVNHGDTGIFATIFFGVLQPTTGALTYINGGHESLVVLDAYGVKGYLKSTGPAVGCLTDAEFQVQKTHLEPGDILFGYTDGVPDARNDKGEFFTQERLQLLLERGAISASSLLDRISHEVFEHIGKADQFDDITLLGVQQNISQPLPTAQPEA